MKEYVITALGKPGGIFDPDIDVIFDSETKINRSGNWVTVNQTNAIGYANITSDYIEVGNTTDSSMYCYSHARNETPISLRSYKYLNITFSSVYNYFSTAETNRIQIRINPVIGKEYSGGDDIVGFYTGTNFWSGNYKNITATTVKIDLSQYTNTGATFRIYTLMAPKSSYIRISKITLTKN